MGEQGNRYRPVQGKTYSLFGDNKTTDEYCGIIKELTDLFLQKCPDEKKLLQQIRKAGSGRTFSGRPSRGQHNNALIPFIKKNLSYSLAEFTTGVKQHLRTLPFSQRFDSILRTKEEQYHLYMIEIELVNRIYKEQFRNSEHKFALVAHCLRDFRPDCRSVTGDVESICKGCTSECFINLGNILLKKYGIHPYISLTMDLEKLFKKLKADHQRIGLLGIACVPELASGMRLSIKLGIPAIGIPLDANRCARWMEKAHESSFNLEELENLLK